MKRDYEEMREAKIAELTEKACASWNARIQANEPRAISDLQNCALDRLSLDDAKAMFVLALTDQAAANAMFANIVQRAMYDASEVEAIKQVEQTEARRADEAQQPRIDMRTWDLLFPGGALA